MSEIKNVQFSINTKTRFGIETLSIDTLYKRNQNLINKISDYHRLKFFILMYVKENQGTHNIDFNEYNISKGDILFISNNQIQAYQEIQKVKGYTILFTEEFLTKNLSTQDIAAYQRLFNNQLYSPKISIPEEMQIEILSIIKALQKEQNQDNDYLKEDILRNQLRILLLKCERELNKQSPLIESAHFKDFITFQKHVNEQFNKSHNAQYYAEIMNISYKHLNDICKEFTNKTAKTYIDNYIILESKRQLALKDISIKEIAYYLGFEEITNFTKFFKKRTSTTPSNYRDSL